MEAVAAPPAAPPPPPPPSDSDANSIVSLSTVDEDGNNEESSRNDCDGGDDSSYSFYQKSTSRTATVPTITNYGLSPQHQFYAGSKGSGQGSTHPNSLRDNYEGRFQYGDFSGGPHTKITRRGDITLRPNTGSTNQEIGAAFGSLREIASALRWMTIATTVTAIFWEGFAFPMRIISSAFVEPSKVVLGAYLGVFCLLVLGVELNAPLQDNFGFLYNPMTRGLVLLLMSTMCIGILKSWWEWLLGVAFVIVGSGYIYAFIRYPEYRRWQDYNANRPSAYQDFREYWMRSERGGGLSIWAKPDQGQERSAWEVIHQTGGEARALLHHL